MRRRTCSKLAPYVEQGIPIVVGGTSCGLELKSDYRELLGIHTAEAKLVAEHVYDINEFLWLQHEEGGSRPTSGPKAAATSRTTRRATRSCTASAGPRSTCWGWCPA